MTQPRVDAIQDIVPILKQIHEGKRNAANSLLVKQLKSSTLQDATLLQCLQQMRDNIILMNKRNEALVDALMELGWTSFDKPLANEFKAFVLHLISAHTCYVNRVVDMLVKTFYGLGSQTVATKSSINKVSTEDDTTKFLLTHSLLQDIVKVIPMSPAVIVFTLSKRFPFIDQKGLNANSRASYLKNMLQVITYMPSHRRAILEIIIERMVKLDVASPKCDILEAEQVAENSKMMMNEIFTMDGEKDKMAHEKADVLDMSMEIMFEYIKSRCFVEGELDWEASKTAYQDILATFISMILPTHATHHVQFLMFYVCSFKQGLCEGFLDFLWKKVQDPNTPSTRKQVLMAYIGSMLSRAAYVSTRIVTACFDLMSAWIHRYIDSHVEGMQSHPDSTLHGAFYSVCQAIFYVFAFRHKELMELPNSHQYFRGLNFERMVMCRLNPLKICLPVIVTNFASVARNYQLAYCYTIMENNRRLELPSLSLTSNSVAQLIKLKPLDLYFPFDPYILTRSKKYLLPIYREYQEVVEDDSKQNVDAEEDDFLNEQDVTTEMMESSIPDFLKYSTSPGFKQELLYL